jgi:hypothetical protein
MMNDVNWKESLYLLPKPVFTEEMGKNPTQNLRTIFEKGATKIRNSNALYD